MPELRSCCTLCIRMEFFLPAEKHIRGGGPPLVRGGRVGFGGVLQSHAWADVRRSTCRLARLARGRPGAAHDKHKAPRREETNLAAEIAFFTELTEAATHM
ncbi:hypothetical protein SKAU_G00051290 [Synaphobranchus kaupii]|uniref:Uncharacterized protein n=1 Tax=Synaphobranchus kaupii TaxID=118154 RepID=A0A9Q1J7M2_SYNKA|nr:hypothetical protein SKAU_G00051290 [Synaphobranchus kaupii]